MTLTKLLPQDLLNDIVPAGQDKPMVWASKYYGTNASGDFGFFPLSASSVLQFANLAAFPVTGVANTLYIDSSTNQAYEWNGTWYDLLGDNEVQPYVNFAGFPATWSEGVTYIALDTDLTYVWDPTTSTYITWPDQYPIAYYANRWYYVNSLTSLINTWVPTSVYDWDDVYTLYDSVHTITTTTPTYVTPWKTLYMRAYLFYYIKFTTLNHDIQVRLWLSHDGNSYRRSSEWINKTFQWYKYDTAVLSYPVTPWTNITWWNSLDCFVVSGISPLDVWGKIERWVYDMKIEYYEA